MCYQMNATSAVMSPQKIKQPQPYVYSASIQCMITSCPTIKLFIHKIEEFQLCNINLFGNEGRIAGSEAVGLRSSPE